MWLQDIRNAGTDAAEPSTLAELRKKRQEQSIERLPASWGSDSVCFSPEARAAAEAASREQPGAQGAPAQSADAVEEFSAYMRKTRNRAQDASYEEKLKSLQDKLKGLQANLAQTAAADMPEEVRSSRVESINSQINSVMEQIAELSAQAAKEGAAS